MLKPGYYDYLAIYNVEWFVDEMIKIENKKKFYFDNTNIPLKMTEEDEERLHKATECWFCYQPFTPLFLVTNKDGKVYGKVRDNCHPVVNIEERLITHVTSKQNNPNLYQ